MFSLFSFVLHKIQIACAAKNNTDNSKHNERHGENRMKKNWEKRFRVAYGAKSATIENFLFVPHRKRESICGSDKNGNLSSSSIWDRGNRCSIFCHFRWFILAVYCVYCSRRMTFGYKVTKHIACASGWNLEWTMPTRWRQFHALVWAQSPIQWQFMQYFSYPPVKRVDMLSFAHIRSTKFSLFRACVWCNNVQLSREIEF